MRQKILLALLVLSLSAPAFSQESFGQVLGVVTDPTKAAIPNAQLVLAGPRVPQGLKASSGADGAYVFAAVPIGTYSLTVTCNGFTTLKQEGIQVLLGSKITFNPALQIGAVTESVEVRDSPTSIDATSSRTSTNITQHEFENLSKGRTFQSLLTMAPGARFEPKSSNAGVGGVSIDGASGIENIYVVDGVEVNDNVNGFLLQNNALPVEFVQEVQVKSAGFEAEYGGATGGVVNVATRGGSNEFHGLVKYEFTNSAMNSSDRGYWQQSFADANLPEFFRPKQDDYSLKYPGASIGGRLIRDRLFFFESYVPEVEHTNRTVNYAAGARTFEQDKLRHYNLSRLDYNPASKVQLYSSWTWSPSKRDGGLPSRDGRAAAPANNQALLGGFTPAQALTGGVTYAATDRLVITGRYGYKYVNNKDNNYGQPGVPYVSYVNSAVGLGLPSQLAQGRGYSNVTSTSSTFRDLTTRHNVYADATYVARIAGQQHTFKGGYNLSRATEDLNVDYTNGYFQFYWGDTFTREPFTPDRGRYGYYLWNDQRAFGKVGGYNQGFYFQDSWRPHSRVTLNLGVRLENEVIPAFRKEYEGVKLEDRLVTFGFGDKIAPRLGGAWDMFGNGRWKLSGSFGLFYDIVKLSMTQSASGANIFFVTAYKLDDPDFTKLSKTTPGALGAQIGRYDNRKILITPDGKWAGINKDVKPSASREFTLSLDHQISAKIVAGVRYTRKDLLKALEDISVLDAQGNETLFRDNPGFGRTRVDPLHIFDGKTPDGQEYLFPKAVRQYDGVEFRVQGQLRHVQLLGSYTWSRLWGNYAGLSNSDEAGRSNPNRSRAFDSPYEYFDASGSQRNQVGRLGTDRPHTFKVFGSYELKNKLGVTNLGLTQLALSGTPDSTQFIYQNASTFPFGRGDLGRTPIFTQTDMLLAHTIKTSEKTSVRLEMDVRNLFNQAAVISRSFQLNRAGAVDARTLPLSKFFAGYNPRDYITFRGTVPLNPVYGLPASAAVGGLASLSGSATTFASQSSAMSVYNPNFGAYQDVRVLRFGARFVF
ncbi:MAG: TonB-dependent receptor [Acidobacteria bacterium]|nr:TonB-dependent receptor [Acidobacteriota bacterium]